ncbi:hypothetical protein DPMN_051262, partial [Dreissena polymorpha]
MASRSANKSRVVRDSELTNLALFGDSALCQRPPVPPELPTVNQPYDRGVKSYVNAAVHNDMFEQQLRFKYGNMHRSSLSIIHGFHAKTFNNDKSDLDLVGHEPKRGLFNPNRPQSAKTIPNNSSGITGRPNSVVNTGRPPTRRPLSAVRTEVASAGHSHHTNAVHHKESLSRPGSRVSKTLNAYQAGLDTQISDGVRYLDDDLGNDPDHEPISDVLSRLNEYSENFVQQVSAACTDCECETEEQRVSSRLARVYSSASEDSASDEDDVGVSLSVVLKTFHQYEEKGHSAARHKAMMTLVHGYTGQEPVSVDQFKQVMVYASTSLSQVQEVCLMVVKKSLRLPSNLQMALSNGVLNFVHDCITQEPLYHLRKVALPVLEVIFSYRDQTDVWLEEASVRFLPKLVAMVRGQTPLEVKYAACCVFRSIAQYEGFISYITQDVLPAVLQMRNTSAKFKEVYVEILTHVLSHTDLIPPDLVDSSAVPITASIIREGPCGPQCASLHLLVSLTADDHGISMVIGTNTLVPMLLCCMKESHCRKVRLLATEVMRNLCTCRKLGLCKDLMLQLSGYLVPSLEQDSLTILSKMATAQGPVAVTMKPRFDEERHMWMGLEKFVDITKAVIYREAKVEVDDLGSVTEIHMKACMDTCPVQLGLISHSFQLLHSVCLWPLDKSRLGFSANRVDLTTFTDDEKQKAKLSKVNRGLTQAIWDKVGVVVTTLLTSYAEKVAKVGKAPTKGRAFCSLETIFEPQEVTLITSLLELILCSSLCTCMAFPEILPKLQEKSSKKKHKSPNKLKSSSTSQVTFVSPDKSSQEVECRLKSQSDSGKVFEDSAEEKIWVKDNPHLTSIHSNSSQVVAMERSKAELLHKEACTERRLLRKCLFEADVFHCVCPFLLCREERITVMVLQIMRCLIQPLEERVAPKLGSSSQDGTAAKNRNRPQTAGAVEKASRRLNIALYKMSPDLAGLIKDALGPQLNPGERAPPSESGEKKEAKKAVINLPASNGLETIQEKLQEYADSTMNQSESKASPPVVEAKPKTRSKPVIDRCRPIAQQCREALIGELEERLIMGIFTRTLKVKKQSVLLLHDFVQYGESSSNMQLSCYGCMPRLLDFLRVNEDNELLEIMGLIIVRLLVGSDHRLKQLFNRHGGPQLLLSMAQYTKGLLKQEVANTLKSISKVEKIKRRPMSAPVQRAQASKVPDVWDH